MPGTAEPNLTVRQVHQPVPLDQFTVGYHPTGLIAEMVAPVIKVAHESDLFYRWNKGQAFRLDRTDGKGSLRADKSRAHQLNFGAIIDSYVAEEFALEALVSDREKQNQDSVLNLAVSKIRRLQDLILLDQDIRVASIFRTVANYPSGNVVTLSGTSQWNNGSFVSQPTGQHSAIQAAFETAKEAVRQSTGGVLPNTAIIPRAVAAVMYNDPGLFDIVKYTTPSLMTQNLLPQSLWGLNVIIPTAVYTTAVEGEPFAGTDVWGKDVWIGYVNSSPGIDQLTFAHILRVREWQTKQYRDEYLDVDVYRPSLVQSEKLIAADCGYLIKAAIA